MKANPHCVILNDPFRLTVKSIDVLLEINVTPPYNLTSD